MAVFDQVKINLSWEDLASCRNLVARPIYTHYII